MNPKTTGKVVVQTIRKAGPLVIGLAALGFVIAWLAGMFESKIPPGHQPPAVPKLAGQPTDVVHEVTKDYIEEAIGTLKAASRTEISAKVLATIDEMLVTAGDIVAAGDELVRLDSAALKTQLKQAEEALAAAKATRVEAEADYSRVQQLFERKVATQSQYDSAKAKLEVARAGVARAEQQLAEAEVLLSYATIKAPNPGRIVDRFAEPGNTARPGEPLLVLYDAASLRLEAPVLEHLAVKLSVGQKLNVRVDAVDRTVEATIDEIVPQADAPSRSFLVKATLPKTEDLYEGMFGRLLIPAGERRHLCLATDAIQHVGQLEFVEVVLPDESLERRFIKTGRLGMPGRVEVLSGLTAGERVVLHERESARVHDDQEG